MSYYNFITHKSLTDWPWIRSMSTWQQTSD